jgi:exoribonuclease R
MPARRVRVVPGEALAAGVAAIRAELELPDGFPADVEAEAAEAARSRAPGERLDLPFVTVDPPGARDLDQALHLQRDGDGVLLHYAIADPASFVTPGGVLDAELHARGMTFYGPDGRIGLHPPVLAEGAASLLPDVDRSACLWTIRLDAGGEITEASVRRARVRSRAQLSYEQVQRSIDDGTADSSLQLLRELGTARLRLETERGGASLPIPEQEVVEVGGRFELRHRSSLPVEDWNAQVSLTTGIAAAQLMRRARTGVLRTLPPADPRDVARLRRTAHALGIAWPSQQGYGELLRGLDAAVPAHAAFLDEATTLFRGAGYLTFDGELPRASPHAAIAAEYAHVTAPLRRLVDRYGLEICLAETAGTRVPSWVRDGLPDLPATMAEAGRRTSAYERACVDLVEAVVLADRIGETFPAVVVDVDERDADAGSQRGTVVVADPAVRARVTGNDLPLGEPVTVRLTVADPDPTRRRVEFALA